MVFTSIYLVLNNLAGHATKKQEIIPAYSFSEYRWP